MSRVNEGPAVTAVVAAAKNRVIGKGGDIPWNIPGEQARFKEVTMGGTLIMGRVTYDSIGRPLPGRHTVVVTRQPDWRVSERHREQVTVAKDPQEALNSALALGKPVFVVGGAEIYRALLDQTTHIHYTLIDAEPDGDAWFPELDTHQWCWEPGEPGPGYTTRHYKRCALPTRGLEVLEETPV